MMDEITENGTTIPHIDVIVNDESATYLVNTRKGAPLSLKNLKVRELEPILLLFGMILLR